MFVRLRQAATVILKDIGEHWHPAGAEVEIPDEHFDAALHESLEPPTLPAAEENTTAPSAAPAEDASPATAAPDFEPKETST